MSICISLPTIRASKSSDPRKRHVRGCDDGDHRETIDKECFLLLTALFVAANGAAKSEVQGATREHLASLARRCCFFVAV